jgi:CBS domain-containing protein
MKTCGEVMTKNPACCLPNEMVYTVAQIMKRINIGSVPVVENEVTRKLMGIVTDRDLVLKIIAGGLDPKSTKVEAAMTQKVVTCQADDEFQIAVDAMSKHQLRRILVVDKENKVLGIIAQADVATRINQSEETATLVKDISQPVSR